MSVWENLKDLKGLNVLNLFAGMEVGRLACERAGVPIDKYYSSEIDKYAIQVSKANWPDIIHLGDVTKVYGCTLPDIHLLLGGSPCQGLSKAGKLLNFKDPRSVLFYEFVRILEELRIFNPGIYFKLENVEMTKESQKIITEKLGVEPRFINSGVFSATERKRLYWTNIPALPLPEDRGIIIDHILEPEVSCKYLVTEKALARGVRKTYSKMRYHPEKALTINTKNNSPQMSIDSGTTLIRVGTADTVKGFDKNKRIYDPKGKCPTLLANSGGHGHAKIAIDPDECIWRRLTPLECERVHNLPDNYTKGVSDTQRYKMIGNGWEAATITHLLLPLGDYSYLF